jgi:hypothetical protein
VGGGVAGGSAALALGFQDVESPPPTHITLLLARDSTHVTPCPASVGTYRSAYIG